MAMACEICTRTYNSEFFDSIHIDADSSDVEFQQIITFNALCGWSKHAHHKSNMADGRHLGKIEKSSYLRNGLTDCHEILYVDAA